MVEQWSGPGGGLRYAYDWTGAAFSVERMRKERLAKAQASLKKHNIDVMLCMLADNVRYTTSTTGPPWMKGLVPGWRYALLVKDQAPILWEHGDIRHITKQNCPWLKKVNFSHTWTRGYPGPMTEHIAKLWAEDIKKELKEQGVAGEKIGLDGPEILSLKTLKDVGIEAVDGQTAMLDARYTKTKDEIECFRTTAAICEIILDETRRAIRPGLRECDITALGFKVAYENGMDDVTGFTVCSGPFGWPNFKFYTDRIIRPGDLVTLDIGGARWNGYMSCYYRTYKCMTRPTEKEKGFYQDALDWLQSAIKATKPGATTADLCREWPDAKKEWGYDSEWEAIANEWGHGLGLGGYEPPMVSRAFSLEYPQTLKEGCVFALETQQGSMKEGGVRIEEMVTVTSSGAEVLSKYPVDEIIVCP
jgi:Xaa-Pro dipeptidase